MQDRFKFRAFDDGKMVYLGELVNVGITSLMQCTGLKDINGKLIYEGDIVSFNRKIEPYKFEEKMYKIGFRECYFTMVRAIGKNTREEIPINRYAIGNSELTYYNLEVIGNIYENKELLNEWWIL